MINQMRVNQKEDQVTDVLVSFSISGLSGFYMLMRNPFIIRIIIIGID
jgi:hypothetical protein